MALGQLVFSAVPPVKKRLTVSSLFSDHMVIQQKQKAALWGQAAPGQKLTITANWGQRISSVADAGGNWKAKLSTPAAGGPYIIAIKTADTSIMIKDVLIGEVWLASGQSNMDIPVRGWPPGDTILNSKQEIENANYPEIRFFKVPFGISVTPLNSINAKWVTTLPQTAGDFSATAYFYARRLRQKLHVPIGIIQSSIGGTPAEAWTSKASLEKLNDFNSVISGFETFQASIDDWFKNVPQLKVPETDEQWRNISFDDQAAANFEFDDSHWSSIKLPGRIDVLNSHEIDGAVWVRGVFVVRDTSANYTLKIGFIDDMDAIHINGKYVGGFVGRGYASTPRNIIIPKELLKQGNNVIAIRIIDIGGQGLVGGDIAISDNKGGTINLAGDWKFRLVAELLNGRFYSYGLQKDISRRPDVNKLNSNSPTTLFNAMINPLIPYTIKGVIWYQGESNVGRAEQYKKLFPLMIEDWRTQWGKQLPFYYVQIAPFLYPAADQKEQSQKLRDAQRYALKLPKTGMVTTLDIGYLKTAHPPYKQEVGKRLATFALKNEYGEKMLVASGPLYKKTIMKGNKLIVEFESIGGGLLASNQGLFNFEIAGADKAYVKAEAKIVNNKVVVSSPSIAVPVYVRYAWSDGSSASLFNKEGLPAATFTSEGGM
ncbi:sialate O-acetylesterase [Mucilaginibacter gossypiicola]|uniref:Sialate O-acetylesterase n=2 Tax=Mucilaginibacter gossypiicola TaxID=551995 RepID=A0A1H8NRY2_9SPHI|nr:sialate O-acetylesterase [Mucilaginibacter gossypiicola]